MSVKTEWLLSASAVLSATSATAQVEQTLGRTFPIPVRSVTLTVSQDLFYDTNIARGSEAAARLRGLENEDIRAVPTVSLDVTAPRGRSLLKVNGSIGYDAYARNTRLNRERLSFSADGQLPLAFCTIAPDIGFSRRQSDLIDLSILPAAPRMSTENTQTLKEAGVTLSCGPDIGFRPSAHIRYAETKNSADLRRGQNVEEVRYGSALNYAHPLVGIAAIFVQRRDFTYDQRDRPIAAANPTFRITNTGVSFDRRLGARLQLVGSLSYADLSSPGSSAWSETYDGLNWQFEAALRIGGKLLVSAETERTITVSPGFSSDFVRQSQYGATLTYALTPLAHIGVDVARVKRDFRLIDVPRGGAITQDRLDTASLRLDYARRQVRFTLRGTYQRRESDNDLFDYSGAQAFLSVSYAFAR